uniref:Uncharacterized protein n=1 Tax=Solanum tuberosum TaxID=4113 RepID=M1DM47_SOLTU
MAANLGKLKTELREAEDNLVKALAGSSLGTFQPPDGITSANFLSEIDNRNHCTVFFNLASAQVKFYYTL